MNFPLFTVAIVTFEQRHLLNDCLKSIFCQRYPNIELIVCDDHSCDFNPIEIEKYIQNNKSKYIKKITVYQQELNVGTVKNCQKAFELSTGEYIKFHAGDDMLANSRVLFSMAQQLKKDDANIIFSRARGCLYTGELTENLYPPQTNFDQAKACENAQELFTKLATVCWGAYVSAPAVFWKRSLLIKMGGFDLSYRYTEDWPMWLKICASGELPRYVDEITVLYRYGGISNSQPELNWELARTHYLESGRMLLEEALPILKKQSLLSSFKCWYAARSIMERATSEIDWQFFSLSQKIFWRCKNLPYIAASYLICVKRDMISSSTLKKPMLYFSLILIIKKTTILLNSFSPQADIIFDIALLTMFFWIVCVVIRKIIHSTFKLLLKSWC